MNECKGFDRTNNWTFDDRKTCLEKTRFERRIQSNPVQEISSRSLKKRKISPRLQNNVFILYGWPDYSYDVASSYDHRSIRDGGPTEDSDFDEKDDNHASLQQLIQWWQQCSLLATKKRTEKVR